MNINQIINSFDKVHEEKRKKIRVFYIKENQIFLKGIYSNDNSLICLKVEKEENKYQCWLEKIIFGLNETHYKDTEIQLDGAILNQLKKIVAKNIRNNSKDLVGLTEYGLTNNHYERNFRKLKDAIEMRDYIIWLENNADKERG